MKLSQVMLLRPDKAGDAIKTLPVIRALKLARPEITLHLLASEHNVSLFAFEPNLTVHVLPRNWRKMKKEKLLSSLQSPVFPPAIDKLVNLLCDPSDGIDFLLESIPATEKFSVSGAAADTVLPYRRLLLPESTPAGRDETANIALLLSQVFGIDLATYLPHVDRAPVISDGDEAEARDKMGEKDGLWLGFCPFAGTTQRTHPQTRWEKFIRRVTADEDFEKYFLFGTPSDYAALEKMRQASPRRDAVELVFPSTFRTLGAYLERLDGVVAVDSGPLHLAHSLGITSLGILSGGDSERWFNQVKEGDVLLKRGFFNRFPTAREMIWAFDKWKPIFDESSLEGSAAV